MRIISGTHKGFRFPQRNMPHARPTTDRAKEALFNILDQRYFYEDIRVLDLYSGMGSVALEFCSRGAKEVTAVDFNRKSIVYINDVAEKLVTDNLSIRQSKVSPYLKNTSEKFDVIFADPPYNANREIQELIQIISQGDFLTSDGIFILEHQTMTQIDHPARVESRNYGQSTFSFFKFVNEHE